MSDAICLNDHIETFPGNFPETGFVINKGINISHKHEHTRKYA